MSFRRNLHFSSSSRVSSIDSLSSDLDSSHQRRDVIKDKNVSQKLKNAINNSIPSHFDFLSHAGIKLP